MKELYGVVLSICSAAVIGSLMYMLLPQGNLSKVIKTVTGIFILGCIILPLFSLKNIDFKSEFDTSAMMKTEELKNTFNSQLAEAAKNNIETMIRSHIQSKNFTVTNIETNTDIDGSGGISIEGVRVKVKCGAAEAQNLQSELIAAYGIDITVMPAEQPKIQ